MKEQIVNAATNLVKVADKNSPTIFTVMAGGGVVLLFGTAFRAGWNVRGIVDKHVEESEDEKPNKPDVVTAVKLTWKEFVTPVTVATFTLASLATAHKISMGRLAGTMTLYSATEKKAKEFEAKCREVLGDDKVEKVKDEVDKDFASKFDGQSILFVNDSASTMRCIDKFTGQKFTSSFDELKRIESEFAKQLAYDGGFICVNDFYDIVGEERIKNGDDIGWNSERLPEFRYSSQLGRDGVPLLVVDYDVIHDIYNEF